MRSRAVGVHYQVMAPTNHRVAPPEGQIEIALQGRQPVPTGHVRVAGEADRPFSGWLGLLSALEAATSVVVRRLDGDGRAPRSDQPADGG
jgi:hypothetical protein